MRISDWSSDVCSSDLLHPRLGKPLRQAVEKGAALVPSAKKMGGIGTAIDVPLGHKDAAYVRSHFDGMEVRVADAPRHGEIVVAVAVTDSGRPLPRIGGLTTAEVKGRSEEHTSELQSLMRISYA